MFIPLELRKRLNKNIRRKILRDFKTKERSYFAVFYNKNRVSIDLVDYEDITDYRGNGKYILLLVNEKKSIWSNSTISHEYIKERYINLI